MTIKIPPSDTEFEDKTIKEVRKSSRGYEITFNDGLSLSIQSPNFVPKKGMRARCYGNGSWGGSVRGLLLNDNIIYYKTKLQEQKEFKLRKKQWEKDDKERTRLAKMAGKIKPAVDIKTEEQLLKYLRSIINRSHDYNTSAEALAQGALAAFNYIAGRLGNSGFQAGYAGLKIAGETMGIEPPYMITEGNQLLYPQYNPYDRVKKWLDEIKPSLAPKARKLLKESKHADPEVKKRWLEAAEWDV